MQKEKKNVFEFRLVFEKETAEIKFCEKRFKDFSAFSNDELCLAYEKCFAEWATIPGA